ncbi:MAG: hypothetical protein B6U69_00700 [Thermofilum sp. ex4484_15]|nr:MAG: hypothetical protein B6U69_00700 [Thermofilum sp. ex4484_15]
MIIALFEDHKVTNFYPLTYTRPVYELRTGLFKLGERLLHFKKPDWEVYFYMRNYLADVYRQQYGIKVNEIPNDETVLLINGRLLPKGEYENLLSKVIDSPNEVAFFSGDSLILAKLRARSLEPLISDRWMINRETISSLKRTVGGIEVSGLNVIEYPWQLISLNKELLREDYVRGKIKGELGNYVSIYGSGELFSLGEGSSVEDYTIIDVRKGPVVIGRNVVIQSGSRLEGPSYIGDECTVVSDSLIRSGTNVGPHCKVGGELKNVIIHANSNKAHEGFLGEAYIGEWVNLGALTTNSDLKNTYGIVKVNIGGIRISTGLRKLGCFIGDMVKTAIGVLIYTGKKVGLASHLYGTVFEDVPSFVIYSKSLNGKIVELELEEVIKIQRRMYRSRGKELSREEEELIRYLYQLTEEERKESLKEKFKLS